ncbi:MAG: energy transducer TonB [Veillonellales bacterium]
MTFPKRWRKAITISLLLHGIFLISLGWVAAKVFQEKELPEQYIELDLADTPALPGDAAGTPPAGSPAQAASMTGASAPASSAAVQHHVPVVTASAASMSVLAVEPGSGSSSGGSEASAGGNGNGSAASTGGSGGTAGSGNGGGGTGGRSGGGGVIAPGILSRTQPAYPERARQAGWEGTVVLKIQILENGTPGSVSVYRSSGYDALDDAAVAAVQHWQFVPARERDSGQAIVCYTTMPVRFRLDS